MKTTRLFLATLGCALLMTGCNKKGDEYAITVMNDTHGTSGATVGGIAAATAAEGATVTLTAIPAEGYEFSKWTVVSGDITLSPDAETSPATFRMPAEAVSVKAEFKALEDPQYAIELIDGVYGMSTSEVDGVFVATAAEGATVTLTAIPANGFMFSKWTVISGNITLSPDAETNPATFQMPAEAVSVKAEFKPVTPSNPGILINGVTWAGSNVDAPGTFADSPEAAGMFYQWSRKTGWSSTDPLVDSDGGTTWNDEIPWRDSWDVDDDPSPTGWRLPTQDEVNSLLDEINVSREWTALNGVNGYKFTDKTSGNSIFLPAAGYRDQKDGKLRLVGDSGYYWSSSSYSVDCSWFLAFEDFFVGQYYLLDTCGCPLRCVLE